MSRMFHPVWFHNGRRIFDNGYSIGLLPGSDFHALLRAFSNYRVDSAKIIGTKVPPTSHIDISIIILRHSTGGPVTCRNS
jgi:hypothetical protein